MRSSTENKAMVRRQILGRGVRNRRVLGAFLRVDRRFFIPRASLSQAYGDHPVPTAQGQTVSQPFMVALMLDALRVERGHKVLEVGSGSGYVLALLAAMGTEPCGMEWHPRLVETMEENLAAAGIDPIPVKVGDGGEGWPERAPFDRVLLSASCPAVPSPLLEQLAPGGILVAPVDAFGGSVLTRVVKDRSDRLKEESLDRCVFVPLLGRYGREAGPRGEAGKRWTR